MKNNFLLLLVIFFTACGTKDQTSTATNTPLNNQVFATWEGEIPCADCPGISYTLDLKNDSTFSEKMVYEGKSVDPFINNGIWIINKDGKIVLTSSTKGSSPQYLLYDGEFVEMLDGDGNKIESNLNHTLHKKEFKNNSATSKDSIKNKIEFKATGNEPFWLVEIDSDKNIHFKQMDGVDIKVPAEKEIKTSDANVTRYHSETLEETITVLLIKKSCTDSMSGIENDYTVTVQLKKKSNKEYQEFNGCGNYLADLRSRPKQEPK